jgi:hypothetical protein
MRSWMLRGVKSRVNGGTAAAQAQRGHGQVEQGVSREVSGDPAKSGDAPVVRMVTVLGWLSPTASSHSAASIRRGLRSA